MDSKYIVISEFLSMLDKYCTDIEGDYAKHVKMILPLMNNPTFGSWIESILRTECLVKCFQLLTMMIPCMITPESDRKQSTDSESSMDQGEERESSKTEQQTVELPTPISAPTRVRVFGAAEMEEPTESVVTTGTTALAPAVKINSYLVSDDECEEDESVPAEVLLTPTSSTSSFDQLCRQMNVNTTNASGGARIGTNTQSASLIGARATAKRRLSSAVATKPSKYRYWLAVAEIDPDVKTDAYNKHQVTYLSDPNEDVHFVVGTHRKTGYQEKHYRPVVVIAPKEAEEWKVKKLTRFQFSLQREGDLHVYCNVDILDERKHLQSTRQHLCVRCTEAQHKKIDEIYKNFE